MSKRMNIDRQNDLEPHRIKFAKTELQRLGFTIDYEDQREIRFNFKGEIVRFYPYSGWHTGKSIKDGRGLKNLISQIS